MPGPLSPGLWAVQNKQACCLCLPVPSQGSPLPLPHLCPFSVLEVRASPLTFEQSGHQVLSSVLFPAGLLQALEGYNGQGLSVRTLCTLSKRILYSELPR